MHATPLDAGRELLELFEEGRETLELLEGALLMLLQGAFEGGQGDVGSLQVAGGVEQRAVGGGQGTFGEGQGGVEKARGVKAAMVSKVSKKE